MLIIGTLVFGGAIALAALLGLVLYALSGGQSTIPTGVMVAGIDIGNQSSKQAAQTLEANLPQTVLLTDGTRNWTVSLAQLGLWVDIDHTLDYAKTAPSGTNLLAWYVVDLNKTQMGLIQMIDQINIPAKPGEAGRSLEIPVMLDRLRVDAPGELADGVLDLAMIETPPLETIAGTGYTGPTTTHVVERGQELGLIAKQYGVSIEDIVKANDIANPDLLFIGQELVIPSAGEYIPENIPAAPIATGKAIVVSTSQQRIYAYENGQMIHTHLTSTGLPATPTVLGDYKVYVKYRATDMSGPGYYLPQVPYTMYFYQGYAIHGAYWHNSFGRPMSHGCVNLPIAEAEWFFNWAEVGTLVRVI